MVDVANITGQDAVFAFLADPATYSLSVPVTRIDTHGAAVFLAGHDVYKVKRAVHFSYMNFSTLEKRKAACEAEIAVNHDNAPELYLGTVPITRDANGLHLGGAGEIVEWTVHLRRFDETATLDCLAKCGSLGRDLVAKLVKSVIAAHKHAPLREGKTATLALRGALLRTVEELCEGSDIFPAQAALELRSQLIAAFDQNESLLLHRRSEGKVRRCHGDLHLRNIALINGVPVLFDAIEFDEAIAVTDILYDLAFLLMDLWQRGLYGDANLLLNRYLWACGDAQKEIEGLALLPLFLSLRALIRAVVTAAQSRGDLKNSQLHTDTLAYFESAQQLLTNAEPLLIAVGGFSGTGKSVLAAALAPSIGSTPGALHIQSDIERKVLFGVGETVRLPDFAYQPEISAQVYERMRCHSEIGLKAGRSIIVDATFTKVDGRKVLANLALDLGVRFMGFWLEAPPDVLRQRIFERRGDASDATAEILADQIREDLGEMTWKKLDASKSLDTLKADALAALA